MNDKRGHPAFSGLSRLRSGRGREKSEDGGTIAFRAFVAPRTADGILPAEEALPHAPLNAVEGGDFEWIHQIGSSQTGHDRLGAGARNSIRELNA